MLKKNTFVLHAVHPIPMRFLRHMSAPQLQFLAEWLFDDEPAVKLSYDMEARLAETVCRIEMILRLQTGLLLVARPLSGAWRMVGDGVGEGTG
jgi:hypothetical protein